MRRLSLIVLATATLFVAVTSPGLSQPPSRDNEGIPRPEWSIGDWWEFRGASGEWRETVIAREGDGYVLAWSASGQTVRDGIGRTTYHADLDGWITKTITYDAKVRDGGDKTEWVKFPLKVGSRWFFSGMFTKVGFPRSRLFMFDYDCRAEGWDTIDIGGRAVRALKISVGRSLPAGCARETWPSTTTFSTG